MIKFLLLVFITLINDHADCTMTDAQLKAAFKLIRNVCQPKTKATDVQIAEMHSGNWHQDKNGQCYVRCILDMYKLMKGNTYDYEYAYATLKSLAPDSIREPALVSLTNCKDAVKTDEKCASAFEVAKCIYNDNPANYFLP